MTTLRAFGAPHRYVQGQGVLAQLEAMAIAYGARRPFVVIDPVVRPTMQARLEAGLGSLAPHTRFASFGGECSADEIHRLRDAAQAAGADLLIGVGGGKAIDTAKGVRITLQAPLFIVPTIASNDSPTSRIAVVYSGEHVLQEVRTMAANPDLVLADTDVLIAAPERFFVSGIGDAISKKFEASQCLAAGGNNFYAARPPMIAGLIADACYETVRAHAEPALAAVRAGKVDEHFEQAVEATILLSGLAFENGGLSIAHSLTRGFSVVPGVASAMHGEQVAFGLLVQLVLERRPESFVDDLLEFYGRVGLPRSLFELGLRDAPEAAAKEIARDTWARAPYVRMLEAPVDEERLAAAVLAAHRLGVQ